MLSAAIWQQSPLGKVIILLHSTVSDQLVTFIARQFRNKMKSNKSVLFHHKTLDLAHFALLLPVSHCDSTGFKYEKCKNVTKCKDHARHCFTQHGLAGFHHSFHLPSASMFTLFITFLTHLFFNVLHNKYNNT